MVCGRMSTVDMACQESSLSGSPVPARRVSDTRAQGNCVVLMSSFCRYVGWLAG